MKFSTTVQASLDPEFTNTEEVVVVVIVEVDDAEMSLGRFALEVVEGGVHAVADEVVLLAVDRDETLRGGDDRQLPDGVLVSGVGQSGIQAFELLPEDANQCRGRGSIPVRLSRASWSTG